MSKNILLELAPGTRLHWNGGDRIVVVVNETNTCKGCCLLGQELCEYVACNTADRQDGTPVTFEFI